jgi:diguanylate cyclase (GGDEF)-like protein
MNQMRIKGRVTAVCLVMFFHTAYNVYYFLRDGSVDIADILGYPVLFLISYWSGLQYDKATFYSEKDVLTNLYNRRFMEKNFENSVALSQRLQSKLFVIMIDCDHFKKINDTYGHQTGDSVLKLIASKLMYNTRQCDVAARWGGDEFMVSGHCKEESDLDLILQRLQSDLQFSSSELSIPVTISIGTSVYPDDHTDLFELIKLADQRMYERKLNKKEFMVNHSKRTLGMQS